MHFRPGLVHHGWVLLYVGKPKRQQYFTDQNVLITRWAVTLAWRAPDGVVRRARFSQSLADTFTPGKTLSYEPHPTMTPTEDWPPMGEATP